MELHRKRVLVVGLARTGIAAARFLHGRGALVRATDRAVESRLGPGVAELRAMGIALELGGHDEESFTRAEMIVLSPGVAHTLPALQAARNRGIPVIGETELAARFIRQPIVAVTGTNGKTTTTELVGSMLAAAGRRVFVGGNIGRPLIEYVDAGTTAEIVVAEVSSFQLDTIESFRPAVGVLLNITPDHLDRHASFADYAAAKLRLFENQDARDIAVLNADDPVVTAHAETIRSRKLFFSAAAAGHAAGLDGNRLILRLPEREAVRLDLARFRLRGAHNAENAAAAALAALAAGAGPAGIQAAIDAFQPAAHRLETIAMINGVEYVNDSKATNVDAVRRGLECFRSPVVLIMGGVDKGGDFSLLEDAVRRHGRGLVLLGDSRDALRSALGGLLPTREVASMREAVEAAQAMAAAGDAVLLAPGCASFDRYANYQERGDDFRRAVKELKPEPNDASSPSVDADSGKDRNR
jgi:UDP-N-acetylmuramoylalanine--D-glutamate ligase